MSQENVEVIRAAFRCFEAGDVDGVLSLVDENVVVIQAPELLVLLGASPNQYGHAGVLEAFGYWPEQWDGFRIEILRVVDAGDRVLLTTTQHGRGKGSGVEVEMPFWFVFAVRAGKIVEWRIFTRESDALKVVGLEE
ncbi:MAG TPA: nuclear transport factor 2 family protein [Solirubrobacteraceae bacterium]|jgi:ketosteroid isomerase-like protein